MNTVVVWETTLDEQWKNSLEQLYAVLGPDEKLKADRFLFEKDRTCSIVARGLLRVFLQHYTGIECSQLQFAYSEYKKPFLISAQQSKTRPVFFNVSHSGNRILHAFASHADMGVDIERIQLDRSVLSIGEHYFTQLEYAQILQCSTEQQHRCFYRLWSCKEAFIKATGKGLFQSLEDFEVILPTDNSGVARLNILAESTSVQQANWLLQELNLSDDFASAVAITSTAASLQIHAYKTEDYFARPIL